MAKQVFINLPVKDLKKAMTFYEAIGFTNNPQFTDETAACMVWSDAIFVMLLTDDKFRQFISKAIIDARQTLGVLVAALHAGASRNKRHVATFGRLHGEPPRLDLKPRRLVFL